MQLKQVVGALEQLAPPALAAEWDNVGLLLEPLEPRPVRRVLLTIDMTEAVLREALQLGSDLIVAYHPPIFSGMKRLTRASALDRALLATLTAGIAVYSPHTALDAVRDGVNDWLADAFGPSTRSAIEPHAIEPHTLERDPLGRGAQSRRARGQRGAIEVEGQGRLLQLKRPAELAVLLRRIKKHLGVKKLRVAVPRARPSRITSVALCAGAGGSLIGEVTADLLLTGEMRHHDVLRAVGRGAVVVLTEHSSSERGYLPRLSRRLRALTGRSLDVRVSREDCEPLVIF
jgi:dinuclear metal center YbgI/SA1388 family protein